MLSNPLLTRILSVCLFSLGCYLALENSRISAEVIGARSGLSMIAAVAIALGITGIELWFASWARREKHLMGVVKIWKRKPVQTSLTLFALGVGLALVYHYDIESTRLHAGFQSTDAYFFAWGVGWLVFGPETTISLSNWLWDQARTNETRNLELSKVQRAENARQRSEAETLESLAVVAGKEKAIRRAQEMWGDVANAAP